MSAERWEGRKKSDGSWEFIPMPESGCFDCIFIFMIILGFIALALGGLDTIWSHGSSFLNYIFTKWWIYFIALVLLLINLCFYVFEKEIMPMAIWETIIMFIVYLVSGCKGYSAYGEWEKMQGFYERGSLFFGVVWMSLFFSAGMILICVCVAALLYKLLLKKLSKTRNVKVRTENQSILWRCSNCKKWNSSENRYCIQCECSQTGRERVKNRNIF